jgi:hypothetical protein
MAEESSAYFASDTIPNHVKLRDRLYRNLTPGDALGDTGLPRPGSFTGRREAVSRAK